MAILGRRSKLFGTERRTDVLILVALLGETYPREIARVSGAPLFSVQRVVDALEAEGILAIRTTGRERRLTLNPRFFAKDQLLALLLRLADARDDLADAVSQLRRRPRRKGKML